MRKFVCVSFARTAAALTAALTVMAAACSSPPAPTPPDPGGGGGGTAELSVDLRHPSEVHLADIKQLTNGGENAEAYWNFAGTELIFQTTRPPYKCDQIMRMPIDGSAEPWLVSTGKGRTTCSYFLPGDEEIVYSSTHERGGDACPPTPDHSKGYVWALYDTYDIYRARADGSELRKLTDRKGYDAEATVCPKDGSILFTSDRDGDLELYRMDADGGNVKQLTQTPGYDGGGFFNRDCTKIVWRASRPQGEELTAYKELLAQGLVRPSKLEVFVADADGSNARQVTYLKGASFAPFFHPSGERILFSSNYKDPRGREFDIFAINVDGTGLEQITYSSGFDGFPMFSPDGSMLAFSSNRNQAKPGETNVFVARWVEDATPAKTSAEAADRFMDAVRWLADDAREGRGVGTAGLAASADWLIAQLKGIGVPGGMPDGGYKQGFSVPVSLRRGEATSLEIARKAVEADAFTPASMSAQGEAAGTTVFAGYGIVSKEHKIDDYRGKNVKNKIAVVRRFVPRTGPLAKDEKLAARMGDLHLKAFLARERGAKALIVVDAPVLAKGESIPDAPLPKLAPTGDSDVGIPVVVVSRAAGAKLVKGRHRVALRVALEQQEAPVHNIVAKIAAGASDRLPGAVVVGAHYDHLGLGGPGSLEGGKQVIHNGADDNASGTAGLLEVARVLTARKAELRRDVYLVAFTAEESGVIGSTRFVKSPPAGLSMKDVVAMLNMDMIGRLRNNQLTVLGGESAEEWKAVVEPACAGAQLRCQIGGDGYGASDHMPFYAAGVPVLQFFSDSHGDYHKASDDAERINAGGGAHVALLVADVAGVVANRAEPLTLKQVPMPVRRGDARATGGSLGTIPAYGESGDKPGMVLGGVRPGGPADKAGLRAGDRIVQIGSTEIRTIRDLMIVLRRAVPGQTALVWFIRDGKKVSVKATFGPPSRRMSR